MGAGSLKHEAVIYRPTWYPKSFMYITLKQQWNCRKCPHSETILRSVPNHGNKETLLNLVTNVIMVTTKDMATLISKRPR